MSSRNYTGQFDYRGRDYDESSYAGETADEPWEGSSNIIKKFTQTKNGFSILNDGNADLTFTINGFTRKLKPGESYANKFPPFKEVSIQATSNYRAEVLV